MCYLERHSREKLGHVLGLLCPSVSKNSIKAKPFVDARATRVSRDAAMGVRLKGSKKIVRMKSLILGAAARGGV